MAVPRAIPYSALPLQDYARRMGINPIYFHGCSVPGLFQTTNNCDSAWKRHTWQSADNVSLEDLAIQLVDAEKTIEEFLGWNVVPKWEKFIVRFPDRGRTRSRYNVRGDWKTIQLPKGKVISGGREKLTSLGYSDINYQETGDSGFEDSATVGLDLPEGRAWLDVKVFPEGLFTDSSWEIRPPGFVFYFGFMQPNYRMMFDSWQFVDPAVVSQFLTDDYYEIDISGGNNLVTRAQVFLSYNDQEEATCKFIWNSKNGQPPVTQPGYIQVVDGEAGIVRCVPSGESCCYEPADLCMSAMPDSVELDIYSGNISQDSLRLKEGMEGNPVYNGSYKGDLSSELAESITLLATARLDRDFCGCNNIVSLGRELRQDMALVSPQGNFLTISQVIQECPFGSRRGEWLAWNRLKYQSSKLHSVAVI